MNKFNKIADYILSEDVDLNTLIFNQVVNTMLADPFSTPKSERPIVGDNIYLELVGSLDVNNPQKQQMAGMFKVTKASKTAITLEPCYEEFEPIKDDIIDGSAVSTKGYKQDETGYKGMKSEIDPSKEPTGKEATPKKEKESEVGKYVKIEPKPLTIKFVQMAKCLYQHNKSCCNPQWVITVVDYIPIEMDDMDDEDVDADFKEPKSIKVDNLNKTDEIKI